MKRAKNAVKYRGKPPSDEDIARADKPSDPHASGTFAVAMERYEPPVARLGRELVDAAIARLEHSDPDRAVTLTTAYIALVTEDERARA